jgi:teichuronic acid exporter
MNSKSLKNSAIKGMFWSATDKFAGQAGQFIFGIILARLLMPKDYGLIGMLSIFLAISQSFIESGMGSGLIQKKDRSDVDFSTVFVFNFAVSILFYLILFYAAPFIADFYSMPQLVLLTRILSINIIINSLAIVQRSKLTINIDFKTIAKVNVTSTILSGIIAVYFAYIGWGVWALVMRTLFSSVISVALFLSFSRWKPSIAFSKDSFKKLFGYGSKLLLAGLYAQLFNNLYNMVIGRYYSVNQLGYYERAKGYADMFSGTVTSIIHQVTFPILASLQNDPKRMISVYARLIKMTSFIIIPSMTLLAILADPLVRLLLTNKWAPAIELLQLVSFARIITPISVINMNILNATGRSDLFLKVDLSKLPLVILALIITIPLGVKFMVIGHVVTSGLAFFINAYMPGKLYGYGSFKQLKDMLPFIIATLVMALIVIFTISIIDSLILKIITGGAIGFVSYVATCGVMKVNEINEVKYFLVKIINDLRGKR